MKTNVSLVLCLAPWLLAHPAAGGSVSTSGLLEVSAKSALGTSAFQVSMAPSWNGVTVSWVCNSSIPRFAPSSCRG